MRHEDYLNYLDVTVGDAVALARLNREGQVADYIPELALVDQEYVSASVLLCDGRQVAAGDNPAQLFTLQSVAKLVVLIGLMEEYGAPRVFSWINAEPSGHSFASLAQLEKFGATPANPLVNAGAIALCGYVPGNEEEREAWVSLWMNRLFNAPLLPDLAVFESERQSGDRNRSLAYLMKSTGVLKGEVDSVLNTYFKTCSYQANITQAAFMPMLLANGGITPDGRRIISEHTGNCVVAIMATCGLYDESGMNLVRTGMPAKSGVSGLMVAVATGRGGVAAFSPRVNKRGSSLRARAILNHVSQALDWHFAAPWGHVRTETLTSG
jgi:glutaminase